MIYTYDKANQLVTSTVNGVTTHYKYDAAGRMIQAGDKSYIYNGQNKVSEVRQNGKTVAKFEYNIDGQIAKAIYGDKVEEFIWDGLALIWRSGVTYINEPYVTGGNPVMAGDDVLFNDMLGSTLAVNDKAVEMTSFGETGDKNAFFTGKPMIDELGYSFLFRDYNPNQGKWTTSDPIGYPDGWNNLAYCNSLATTAIDWMGGTIYEIAGANKSVRNPVGSGVAEFGNNKYFIESAIRFDSNRSNGYSQANVVVKITATSRLYYTAKEYEHWSSVMDSRLSNTASVTVSINDGDGIATSIRPSSILNDRNKNKGYSQGYAINSNIEWDSQKASDGWTYGTVSIIVRYNNADIKVSGEKSGVSYSTQQEVFVVRVRKE